MIALVATVVAWTTRRHVAAARLALGQAALERGHEAQRRVLRRGEHLDDADGAGLAVDQRGVRERAADVDADTQGAHQALRRALGGGGGGVERLGLGIHDHAVDGAGALGRDLALGHVHGHALGGALERRLGAAAARRLHAHDVVRLQLEGDL